VCARAAAATAAAALLIAALPTPAAAQNDPNAGALTVTAGVDFPSVYVFRGIVQESDPGFTMFPWADFGWSLASRDNGVQSIGVNAGVWHSLQTGSSGSDGPSDRIHYQENFYGALALGFGGGYTLSSIFTAYTSPNNMFNTIKEAGFRLSRRQMLNPYGLLAFELGGDGAGQADGGSNTGTYLELGVLPTWNIRNTRATLTVPARIGLSLKNYYELGDQDNKFGFFDVGGLVAYPFTTPGSRFGVWNVHGGIDVYALGTTTQAINDGDKAKVVASVGIGVSY
jgi:hypothetical protein